MKSERFEMRLDTGTANRVDIWRDKQPDGPSRAEAFRRLVDVGLAVVNPDEIYPTSSEKLMLSMLCEVLKQQKKRTEIDPDFVQAVISGGHYWALGWQYGGLFHNHVDTPANVRLVADILTMWSDIEFAIEYLTEEEQAELKSCDKIFSTQFMGFDGNEETDYFCIAQLMTNEMGRFQSLKDDKRDFNSHWPTLDTHTALLRKYTFAKPKLTGRRLTLEELQTILSTDG